MPKNQRYQGKRSQGRQSSTFNLSSGWIIGGVVAVGAILLALIVLSPSPAPPPANGLTPPEVESEDPSLGDPNAAVTIVEFSDFQCSFCARFALETFSLLRQEYIDSGKVFLVFRDFPLPSHQQAPKAAEAANCAAEQDQFWTIHDILFSRQAEWEGNPQAVSIFKGYAQDLGMDSAAFDSCLDSGKYVGEIQEDVQAGLGAGVTGTPTFFINNQTIVGAQPFSEFQRVIEQELLS